MYISTELPLKGTLYILSSLQIVMKSNYIVKKMCRHTCSKEDVQAANFVRHKGIWTIWNSNNDDDKNNSKRNLITFGEDEKVLGLDIRLGVQQQFPHLDINPFINTTIYLFVFEQVLS